MYREKFYDFIPPPEQSGSYRIRDMEGSIIYWGDSTNLYRTWCERVQGHSSLEKVTFEYTLANYENSNAFSGTCYMSDFLKKGEI